MMAYSLNYGWVRSFKRTFGVVPQVRASPAKGGATHFNNLLEINELSTSSADLNIHKAENS